MKTHLAALILGFVLAFLSGCTTSEPTRDDPVATLANLEKKESIDHVLLASRIGKAAIQYERAFGHWPRSPKALAKKLSSPVDFAAFEELSFQVVNDDLLTMSFKLYGADFLIENQADRSPLSEKEKSRFKEKSYRIEI